MKYEVELTAANLKSHHIYISSFLPRLPDDVIGGSRRDRPASAMITLESDGHTCRTDVPTDVQGRPRNFFRDRAFVRDFFERTGAAHGDAVVFDHVAPYHLILSLRRK